MYDKPDTAYYVHTQCSKIHKKVQFLGEILTAVCLKTKISLIGDTIRQIDIISRCFEKKNNNCCEIKLCKNAICFLLITNLNLQIHDLATLIPGHPSCRVARSEFVNYK